ncbi:MAG: glycyl radical protein [Coriobacteriales bacterium]|jgi:pyruvate formate-lyase/glycerol dehydratase family glycyl radical enzyme
MFEYMPISERVQNIRARYRTTMPKVCIERYKIVTEFYREHPELPGDLKRALVFKELCEKMPVVVHEGEVIVGTQASAYRGSALYPEIMADWIKPTLSSGNISTRTDDPYEVDEDEVKYVLDTVSFWDKNSFSKRFDAVIPKSYEPHQFNGIVDWAMHNSASTPIGHICPGFDVAIDQGLAPIRDKAQAWIDAHDGKIFGSDAPKYEFYRMVVIVIDAIIRFADRYGDECERLAGEEMDPARKQELLEMADTMHWIYKKPCRTFHDAVQALFFYQMCECLDGQQHGNSLGRVDQHLGKYYVADLAEGRITPDRAQELIDLFVLKIAEMNKVGPDGSAAGAPGYTSGQLMTIGGVDAQGNDATNPVTFMFLQTAGRLILHDPPLALRIHENTPQEVWEAAIATTSRCGGVPTFENDQVIIPALMKRGLPLGIARQYALIGCLEPMVPGWEFGCPGGSGRQSFFVLPNALMLAINNGVNPMPRMDGQPAVQCGVATGYLYEMESMEEVLAAVKAQIDYFADWWVSLTNLYELEVADQVPMPLLSATTHGCMEKGLDIMRGGAEYNSCGIAAVGIGNIVDSLGVIDQLCFQRKDATTRELYDAIMANWEGYDELRAHVVNDLEHYGNGEPEVDKYLKWVGDTFCDKINSMTGPRGHYAAGIWPVTMHVVYGKITWATPDGRHAGEPLSDGIGPVQSMDKNGPTALLNSVGWLDQSKCSNGTLLNMRFHPNAISSASGKEKLEDLMKTYFDNAGMQMQLNIIGTETLRDAQKSPENYQDLVVRIAGFSSYFVEVNKETQDDLIRRTQQEL